MKKFYRVENSVDGSGSEIYIDGTIASEEWWGDESTPRQLREELSGISGKVTVIINSGGGDVWAGVAMYNALKELDARVTVRVDGLAASIASVIAMAGDEIIMSPGSNMMIHKASTWAGGNADDLAKTIEMLESIEGSIGQIYADRTGKTVDEIQALLNAETWFTAQEAVDAGFADRVGGQVLEPIASNALSGKLAFSMKATEESIERAKAAQAEAPAADADKEKEDNVDPTPTPPANDAGEGDEVTPSGNEPEPKDDEEEVAPEAGEKSDPVAENKKDKKEPTAMTEKEKAAAAKAALEVKNQAKPEAAKPDMSAYLKTKASMEAFAQILEDNAGKDAATVRAAWQGHLETTMGVTNPEIFLPEALITRIEDAFEEGGEIWNRVSKTGADVFRSAWDNQDDVSAEAGRGRGYNRSRAEEKAEQELTFADRVIRPQFVYKYITLNREDVKNQRTTGALVTFVLAELPRRIIREVERAIVIGDGRAVDSDYKINESSDGGIFSIKTDAATPTNIFATSYTPVAGEGIYATIVKAKSQVKAPGRRVLIAKDGFLLGLTLQQNANGGLLFAPGTDFARTLGFDAVIEPDWFTDVTDPENDAYIVTLENYRTVGDTSIEAFTNFLLKTNKQEYLQEIYVGGGLSVRRSAVAIAALSAS